MSEEKSKEPYNELLDEYMKNRKNSAVTANTIPSGNFKNLNNLNTKNSSLMSETTDPDLTIGFEIVKLPSEGIHYSHRISEVKIEYMTSKDEDLISTQSLIANGTVLDELLKRKIKTPGINVDELLTGDKDCLLLFLRISSYGKEYAVEVIDPRTGKPFKTTIDLLKLKYKEIEEKPNEYGHFSVLLPMRQKVVQFRLLKSSEENAIFQKAEALQEAFNTPFSEYNTMKLKSMIISIDGKTDRTYIERFVDAMPSRDCLEIRKKAINCSPGMDMKYEFTAKDGFKFEAVLSIGVDFFFPS